MTELLSGILGLLIGGLIGHRLALGRDKRLEFNEAAAPLQEALIQTEDRARQGFAWKAWSDKDVSRLKPYLSDRERDKLDELIQKYQDAWGNAHIQDQSFGDMKPVPEKYPELIKSLVNLRAHVQLR